ncbi:hypothetical protein AB205_0072360, partial [Aquarana catesbeiana]
MSISIIDQSAGNVSSVKTSYTPEKPHGVSKCIHVQCAGEIHHIHPRSHTGQQPYSHPVCGKCFIYKLLTHQIFQSDEHPHSWSECGKLFSYETPPGHAWIKTCPVQE